MKLPRDLAGNDLAKHLCKHWGYSIVHQVGSHMILQTEDPSHQRMPIPAHGFLRIGTLNAMLRLVATHKGVSKEEILSDL